MHKTNIDFFPDVPSVLAFLDKFDSSKTGEKMYLSTQSSRTYETAIVRMLPVAKQMILMTVLFQKINIING